MPVFFFARYRLLTVVGRSFFALLRAYTYLRECLKVLLFARMFDDDRKAERKIDIRRDYLSVTSARVNIISIVRLCAGRGDAFVPFGKWTFVICRGIEYKRVDFCSDDGQALIFSGI